MKGMIGAAGVLFPLVVAVGSALLPLRARVAWGTALATSLFSWFCFLYLVISGYLLKDSSLPYVWSIYSGSLEWAEPFGFSWDFFSLVMSLVCSSVFVCFHFLSRPKINYSWIYQAGLCAFQAFLLGAIGADKLFLFAIFFGGSIIPRFLFSGEGLGASGGIRPLRESTLYSILACLFLLVVVLLFSSPFQGGLSDWFMFSIGAFEASPKMIGLSLVLMAAAMAGGIFPFHGTIRSMFRMDPIERSLPLVLQPIFGFVILFRHAWQFFPAEFHLFAPTILRVFCFLFLYAAFCLWGSRSGRERIFWLQQVALMFVVIGIFGLNDKGWIGASAVLVYQSLVAPLLVSVYACELRRAGGIKPLKAPAFALVSSLSILFSIFMPVSFGFYGALLVIWSLAGASFWSVAPVIAGLPIVVIMGMRSMFFHLGDDAPLGNDGEDLGRDEMLAVVPLAAALVFLGILPGLLLTPLGAAAIALLKNFGGTN